MKRTLVLTTALSFAAAGAIAQTVQFADVDSNGDDILTQEELAAVVGPEGAASVIDQLDGDDDGTITLAEAQVTAAPAPGMAEPAQNADTMDGMSEMDTMDGMESGTMMEDDSMMEGDSMMESSDDM
ncbi:hypothetical protein [Pelagovum pacificum]|uniref:EF-hand domain-containing protein n=1 Tax=Pelagovum pacificum TaxID=2588711 RepID=A0A5C5GCU1_9RHOB|nr:hypothetical protein [Pelagovum pacificum]QQA42324.1 hypothetical protein I8N54_16250 [Pelagovum pacificum]TNY31409.1 hypothetical protein FHY64_15440 [Pelagovum pacificum]